ncbi:Uncharacterised protein [Kluyvera cryocrescens]|uniref:Bacterial Ig-like domain-containing protein n=2 Tax=Kluyvera cryocrescens TaxID=580 RepID=A0A485CXB4_KLUCR|nr:Uncharacterised protein [Kluyvera cryocrescens]
MVSIYNDTKLVGSVEVTATDGSWSFTTDELDDGVASLTTKVTDKAGNVSEPTPPIVLHIDATAPAVPQAITGTDDVAWYQGAINHNGLTNDAQPTLSGVVEGNASVTI